MNNTADVIIIGSGIIGSSTAYYLARRGLDVLVLERSDSVGDGASSRNGAGVRIASRVRPESDLANEAIRKIWPTLSEELEADLEYETPGSLTLATNASQEAALAGSLKKTLAAGIDAEIISGDEARKMCPYLAPSVTKALFCAEDGYANPMVTTLAYYKQNRKMGVRYVTGENVISLRKVQGHMRQVITENGSVYEADKVVLAAGFNSRRIAESAGLWLPFLKRVDECIVTEVQPRMFRYRIAIAGGHFYGHQTRHGSFIFGGNTDLERYELTYDGKARNTNKSCPDKCRTVGKYIPALAGAKVVRQWAGWLDSMVDRLPVMQEIPEVPGLILACGFSGHGFAIGPAAGKCVAQLVVGETPCVDLTGLEYDRFRPHGC